MKIDNWFVRSERVKDKHVGLIRYCKYLINELHKNHSGKCKIIPMLGNTDDFIRVVSSKAVNLDLENSRKKGGRPVQSYAQSFVFSLPPSIKKPTPNEWKLITVDIIKQMAKYLKLDVQDLNGCVFANVHDQDNPHLNLLISRVIKGKAQSTIDQKGIIGLVKKVFTASTLTRCGLDVSGYEPLQTNLGKRQTKWQVIENQALASLEEVKKETKNLQIAAEKAKDLARFSEKMNGQLEDWLEAIKADDRSHNDEREFESNEKREQITSLNLPDNQVKLMDEAFNTSETKSGKPIKNRVRYKT